MRATLCGLAVFLFTACKTAGTPPAEQTQRAEQPGSSGWTVSKVALPGGGPQGVAMDALAYDSSRQTVWVPAGNTGSVDVLDTATGKLTRIEGFPTKTIDAHGHSRTVGPSAAAAGDGVVYVGNRGDSSVCAIDAATLTRRTCANLDSSPDLLAYVPATHEVWVTTPRDSSIRVLDANTLAPKAKLTFEGSPEGCAVDDARHRFYTNLEDKDRTLAIDLDSHQVVASWQPHCGEEGPHGLAFDAAGGFLFVACSAKAEALDARHDGALVGSLETGDGMDLLDFAAADRRLYLAAGKAGTLTVAAVAQNGALSSVAVVPTAPRARNPVVAANGNVYLADSPGSALLVVSPPSR
jgi:DNA-binding beta-propeller fold protein YncE